MIPSREHGPFPRLAPTRVLHALVRDDRPQPAHPRLNRNFQPRVRLQPFLQVPAHLRRLLVVHLIRNPRRQIAFRPEDPLDPNDEIRPRAEIVGIHPTLITIPPPPALGEIASQFSPYRLPSSAFLCS